MRTNIYKAILSNLEKDKRGYEADLDCVSIEIDQLTSQYLGLRRAHIKKNFKPVLTYLNTVSRKETEVIYDNYRPTGEVLKVFESSDKYVLIWKGHIEYFTLLSYSTVKSNLRGKIKTFSLSMPLRKHLLASKNLNFLHDIILYNNKKVLAYSTDY